MQVWIWMGEVDGTRVNGELSSIEDDETSISNDVKVDRDIASEFAGCEVRFQVNIVAFRDSEFGERRVPL